MKRTLLLSLAMLLTTQSTAFTAEKMICASSSQTKKVMAFYTKTRPGAVTPIPARRLNVPEAVIASGVEGTYSVGVRATPEIVSNVWATIDAWGARTKVGLVLTSEGPHAYDFPSLVPISLPDDGSGFIDMEADGGRGVHGHIFKSTIQSIYAVKLPDNKGGFSRLVSFYGPNGHLVLGVYASKAGGYGDKNAITGFAKSWDLIKSLPRACKK